MSDLSQTITWRVSARASWVMDRPRVLAIVNVTPDSFSDGGTITSPDDAARAAMAAITAGAAGLDVGGESTRPGAERVPPDEQIRRVVPAVAAIRREVGDGPVISIDTTRAEVARAALDAGADAINDVSGGTEDPGLLPLAATRRCGVILMHRLAPPPSDSYSHEYATQPDYGTSGVTAGVIAHLRERLAAAVVLGCEAEAVMLDPGLGFGKSVEQNLELIRQTGRLLEIGRPILSGVSRKSFTARAAGLDMALAPATRVHASVGLSVLHLHTGARVFRVHDVAEHVAALTAAWSAMGSAAGGGGGQSGSDGVTARLV